MPNILDFLVDEQSRRDMLANLRNLGQSASNTIAGNVTGPVDLAAWGLRKIGVPVGNAPVGGSEWAKQKGLLGDVKPGASAFVGETLGLLAPILAAEKAPQIARGLLQIGENAMAPRTLNKQAGVVKIAKEKPFTYPQDAALETARQNGVKMLGLPENNTPAQRAAAMGFDRNVSHGGNADIHRFDPSLANSRRGTGTPDGAVVVTTNPKTASTYAGESTDSWGNVAGYADGGNVMPLMVRAPKGSEMSVTAKGANWNDIYDQKLRDVISTNEIADIGKQKGKSIVTVRNVLDNATWSKQNGIDSRLGNTSFVFDPSLVRSRFAAFDPARINENDLLAGTLPFLLTDEEQRKQLRGLLN